MTQPEAPTPSRRRLFALLAGGTVAAAATPLLTPAPAEADPDDVIDGGTP